LVTFFVIANMAAKVRGGELGFRPAAATYDGTNMTSSIVGRFTAGIAYQLPL
jgi:hypothetical protein